MRALVCRELGPVDRLVVEELPDPVPGEREVVIRVHAAGVNFPDGLIVQGKYQVKPPLPFIPGAEVAGVVVSAPEGSGLVAGDRVCALPLLGGFAEQVVAQTDLTFKLPDSVSFEEGASFLFNYGTSYFALI